MKYCVIHHHLILHLTFDIFHEFSVEMSNNRTVSKLFIRF